MNCKIEYFQLMENEYNHLQKPTAITVALAVLRFDRQLLKRVKLQETGGLELLLEEALLPDL